MCGIAGIVSVAPLAGNTELIVQRMCASLRHRGPDESCVTCRERAILGMCRLAVVDTVKGRLPVTNEDASVVVAFNGEIYNYRELRSQLRARGHHFRTQTDTEVIAHLYEQYGERFVDHLDGMFAISLWDDRRQQMLLVRDRLGVKPLFYHVRAGSLRFASEIKAILQDPVVPRHANLAALDQMLCLGCTATPETFFEGIYELPAASLMRFRRGRCEIRSYWDAAESVSSRGFKTKDAVDEGMSRVRLAVEKRMVSDVPIGAFLSGGIDSSVIVALMSQKMSEPVKTFSIGFEDADFSELPFARIVSRKFNTEHREFVVQPDVERLLPRLIAHHDGPFYDSSAIPTYHLCRLAKQYVTVALAGDGGDELFAGYRTFAADRAAECLRWIPRVFRRSLLPMASWLVPEVSGYTNRGRVVREFLQAAESDPLSRYARWATKTKRETRQELYSHSDLRKQLATADAERLRGWYERPRNASRLRRLLYVATFGELAGDMLVKVDRMSMASSLEVRSPFLDQSLFEWSHTLPDHLKLHALQGKYLLRRIAARILPRSIVRRRKRGFAVPLDRWLRTSQREWVKSILLDDRTRRRGLFDHRTVERMIAEHQHVQRSYGRELWTLLTIEMWFRMYIDDFSSRVTGHKTPVGSPDYAPAG